jgi:hypothetical protein
MNVLLRSMFIGGTDEVPELAFGNYLMFDNAGLGFDVPEDVILWEFLKDFCRTHNHCPNLSTLRDHYTRVGEDVVVDRLEQLIVFSPIYKGDFEGRLSNRAHERKVRFVREVLREADTIIRGGLEVKDAQGKNAKTLLGPIDAVRYVLDKSHDIVSPTLGSRLSGEVTGDGEDFLDEYTRRKLDPLSGIGQFSGLTQIDITLAGAKKFELWTHAAFTGGLKSTFMLNWMYNQAVWYGHNCLAFSIEMPYEQCRRILYAMHSMHKRFDDVRIKLGIQQKKDIDAGLEYKKMRDGVLSSNEEIFLQEYVVPDLMGTISVNPSPDDPQGGYGDIHIEVADPDKSDFTMDDIRSKAELMYSKDPFKVIFIDHMGLLSSRRNHRSTTERLNEVVRDAKRMAMSFNRGQGIAVVGLFQISREGFKSAEKNSGNYNLTHLSYANECERSSDIVTTSYVDDELRKQNRVRFQCLKARDDAPFDPFHARVEWGCRRILTSFDVDMINTQKEEVGNAVDQQLAEQLDS